MKDQVVTIFNLREEEPVLTPRFFVGGHLQSGRNLGIKLSSRKGVSRGDVSEPYQGMHQRKLAWVVEFQAGNPFTTGKHLWVEPSYAIALGRQRFPECPVGQDLLDNSVRLKSQPQAVARSFSVSLDASEAN